MRYLYISICFLLVHSCGDKQEKIFPQEKNLTESVYTSATVQPDSLYQVYAAVGGILDKNLVEEGDVVQKGTPLFQIVDTAPKLNFENVKLSLGLAKENLNGSAAIVKDFEDQIQAATLSFQNDSLNFNRQKRLWEQQIGSKVEFENRQLAYQLSRNNLSLLKSRYNRTKNELQTQVRKAQNNYRTAQVNTKDFTVTSKISGKVYAVLKEPGEIVNIMEPLAALGSDTVFVIEMLVDEVDIVKLVIGQKVLIMLDAYPAEVFTATLSKIFPRKDERSQTFTVEGVFIDSPKILYPGLAGEGNIVIAEKENTLTIPKTYLFEGNKVMTPDGIVEVVIGLQNLDLVEILEGITVNTELLKPKE